MQCVAQTKEKRRRSRLTARGMHNQGVLNEYVMRLDEDRRRYWGQQPIEYPQYQQRMMPPRMPYPRPPPRPYYQQQPLLYVRNQHLQRVNELQQRNPHLAGPPHMPPPGGIPGRYPLALIAPRPPHYVLPGHQPPPEVEPWGPPKRRASSDDSSSVVAHVEQQEPPPKEEPRRDADADPIVARSTRAAPEDEPVAPKPAAAEEKEPPPTAPPSSDEAVPAPAAEEPVEEEAAPTEPPKPPEETEPASKRRRLTTEDTEAIDEVTWQTWVHLTRRLVDHGQTRYVARNYLRQLVAADFRGESSYEDSEDYAEDQPSDDALDEDTADDVDDRSAEPPKPPNPTQHVLDALIELTDAEQRKSKDPPQLKNGSHKKPGPNEKLIAVQKNGTSPMEYITLLVRSQETHPSESPAGGTNDERRTPPVPATVF